MSHYKAEKPQNRPTREEIKREREREKDRERER